MGNYITISMKRWLSVIAVCLAIVAVFGINEFVSTTYAYTETPGIINDGPVQVRKEPVNGDRITSLSVNTAITVIDETTGSDGYLWYKIRFSYGGKSFEGYTRSDFITLTPVDTSVPSTVTDASVAGSTGIVSNTNLGVFVRTGAGTAYTQICKVYKDQQLSLLGQTANNGKIWYNVSFTLEGNPYTGWISGDYVTITATGNEGGTTTATDEEFLASLKAAGFPDSYCTSLLALHQKYPNWQFVPVQTGLDWNDVITNQSVAGKNLVQKSVNDARKSTDAAAYDWSTNTWYGYDGANWVCASPAYIAYCMDPRNFLNDTYVFQFETLEYAPYQNATGVNNVLAGTFMAGNYNDTDGTTRSYADTFVEIGTAIGVSPYHLASRCKQEQGTKGSTLITGTYSGFTGYYNYFNINAYTTSTASSITNGLAYAKAAGWDSIYKSISGGSSIVADRYVKKGQNTVYFEKFNVVNSSNLYSHQYMTNVMAAISEGSSISKAYSDKSAAFLFRIPVYNNMPETAAAFNDNGNPNNWLSSMTVSGYNLTPAFQPATTEYSLIVEDSVSSITVGANAVYEKATITGTGNYSLNYGNNNISVTCISQSGSARTYNINVVRQQTEGTTTPPAENVTPSEGTTTPPAGTTTPSEGTVTPPAGSISVADGAYISTNYAVGTEITGIAPGTTAGSLISNIAANNCTVKVLKADGTENTGNVGTGNKVTVYVNGSVVKQYEAVLYGDINGDGKISNLDLVMLQKQILGISNLSGSYQKAADVGKDGKVSNLDIVLMQKHILNMIQISQ